MSLAPLDSESISMTKCSNDCRQPVCNTGWLCGNGCCRLCRSKTIRSAQHRQHASMTEPYGLKYAPFREGHAD